MAFDVSALAAYIEDRDFPLIGELQVSPELTANKATKQVGLKGTSRLHYMSTDVIFQDGAGCTRTASGTTDFTDKSITVGQIAIREDLCLDDLRNKWTQILLEQGTLTGKQVLPSEIAEIYFNEKNLKTIQSLDVADWQGDTGSGSANLQRYDGWIKLIDAGSPVDGNVDAVTVATGVTAANILDILEGMYNSTTEEMDDKSDLVMYIPRSWYKLYISALKAANLYHYNGNDGQTTYYGTTMEIRPTYGLRTLDRAFITYPSNLVIGMDGENDLDFNSRLDPVTEKKVFVDAEFTRGTQVFFTDQVVEFTLVP
ncbi:hypothetical protein CL622_04120 [archaeon]|nr:hypothetical protein [archaeon]